MPMCSDDRRMEFRIGINLGDIIFEDGDIYGEGVNIAARIEQLADIGGICVTAAVHGQVDGRLEVVFEDLGEKMLKNISRPVRIYRVVPPRRTRGRSRGRRDAAREAVVKPTVAVLPFTNMSGDPEQEFFADGLTEDILTELSRRHELFVISRTRPLFTRASRPICARSRTNLARAIWSKAACARPATACASPFS